MDRLDLSDTSSTLYGLDRRPSAVGRALDHSSRNWPEDYPDNDAWRRAVAGECVDAGDGERLEPLFDAGGNVTAILRAHPTPTTEDPAHPFFELPLIGMTLVDEQGRLTRVNPYFCELLGYPADELLGKTWDDLAAPESVGERHRQIELALRENRRQATFDGRLVRKDGSVVDVTVSGCASKRHEGRAIEFAGFVLNNSDRKNIERQLERSQVRLRETQTLARIGGFSWDRADDSLTGSDEAARLCGLPTSGPAQLATLRDRVLPADHQKLDRLAADAVAGRPTENVELQMISADGQVRTVKVSTHVERAPDGSVQRIFGTVQDVTSQRESEHQYSALVENMRDGVVVLDYCDDSEITGCPVLSINPGFTSATGATPPHHGTYAIRDLFPAHAGAWESASQHALNTGLPIRRKFDGEDGTRVLEISAYRPLPNRLALIVTNVTLGHQMAHDLRSSEERLEYALEASRDGVYDWECSTGQVYLSPRYYRMLCYEPGELTASFETWRGLIHPDDIPATDRLLAAVYEGLESAYSSELRLKNKHGDYIWVLDRGKVVQFGPDGKPLRVVGTLVDLTETKRVELALRQSEELYRTLILTSPDGIMLIDPAGHVTFASPRTAEILGMDPKQPWDDISVPDLVIPEDRARLARNLRRRLRGDASTDTNEYTALCADGTCRPLEVKSRLIRNSDGKPRLLVSVVRDVTLRKQLEEEVRHSQKMEAVGRLAGSIAHDFNNLLTVINGFAEMAQNATEPGNRAHGLIGQVRMAGEKAASVTAQLLAFSRKEPPTLGIVDLRAALQGFLAVVHQLAGPAIRLETSICDEPCPILSDATRVEQVLLNLTVNARDAMPEGGTLTLCLRAGDRDSDGPSFLLEVGDTGCGMPPEVRHRIFEPFYTTKSKGAGTGLGLSTVYGAVHQAGGRIEVTSEVGKGTRFTLSFPAAASHAEGDPPSEPQLAELHGSETILVAEDQNEVREMTVAVLHSYGYRVLAAASGPAALALWEAHPAGAIGLVLSDVVMPGMSGPDLVLQLLRRHPEQPVLFMTGFPDTKLTAPELRDIDVLPKPFSPAGLAARIRGILDARSARR